MRGIETQRRLVFVSHAIVDDNEIAHLLCGRSVWGTGYGGTSQLRLVIAILAWDYVRGVVTGALTIVQAMQTAQRTYSTTRA